jgi:O-antigen/teichoic acid export membrane protein
MAVAAPDNQTNLKQKAVRAAGWLAFAKIFGQGFQFIITITLARLLVPKDYGLIALASLITEFLRNFNELGLGTSVVQMKEVEDRILHSLFWFSLAISTGIYLVSFLLAPVAEWYFRAPGLSTVFRVLALTLIIGSLKTVPAAMMVRAVDFKRISISEAVAFFASGSTSITLAFLGHGVWALVFGALAYDVCNMLLVFFWQPWRPRLSFHRDKVRDMLHFGVTVTGSRLLFNTYQEADNFVVGRVLGPISLGFYSMSFRLARLPVEKISAVVNNIAFPVFSRVQDDLPVLRGYYLKVARLISMLTFPLMVGGIVLAPDLIGVVLTDKWAPSVLAFQILSASAILQSVYTINGHVLTARGRVKKLFRYQVLAVIALPLAFFIGTKKGINGVALGWLCIEPLLMTYMFFMVFREIGVRVGEYLRTLAPAICGAAGMAAMVLAFQRVAAPLIARPSLRLGAAVACGALGYLAIVLTFFRDAVLGLRSMLRTSPPKAAAA